MYQQYNFDQIKRQVNYLLEIPFRRRWEHALVAQLEQCFALPLDNSPTPCLLMNLVPHHFDGLRQPNLVRLNALDLDAHH